MTLAKKNGYTIHEGPMADTRGTSWREDAARLEAAAQERRENPMKSPPNNLTSIDKAHAARAKGDGGRFNSTDLEREGADTIQGEE